jgi:hypothetical protein
MGFEALQASVNTFLATGKSGGAPTVSSQGSCSGQNPQSGEPFLVVTIFWS